MPSLRQLEYLVALADTRHFRRAAERSSTTQPTLSEQLKVLEDRLGTQLIERNRSGALLTPSGERIVEVARRMLNDAHEIRSIAAMDDGTPRGLLRIGVPATIGPYLLPLVVPKLRHHYPKLMLFAREDFPQALLRSLEEGAHDVVVAPLPVRGEDFDIRDLFREPLYLAMSSEHPLAQKPRVEKSDLRDLDVLTLGPGHQLHDVVQSLCDEFGARIRTDYESTSLEMLKEMVATGLGLAFMPALYVQRELRASPGIKFVSLNGRSIHRSIGLVWRRSSPRNELFEKLFDLIRDAVQKEFSETARQA